LAPDHEMLVRREPINTEQSALNVEFAGKHFKLDAAEGMDLVGQKIAQGGYETPLPILIAAMVCRLQGLFIDVGANNGVYSLIAASMRPDVKIVAFEPVPSIAALVRRNIVLNSLEDRVRLVEMALSDTEGEATIYLPDPGHGLIETSASLQQGFISGATPAMIVKTGRLDDIAFEERVAVAKVDIEGFELEFLRGAYETIVRDRPVIFAEMLYPVANKFPEITRRMADADYLLFRLRPDMAILAHWVVFDDQSWNYCFLPRERLPVFREICSTHGLEILAPA
jgi:FkbM family methyltransferase